MTKTSKKKSSSQLYSNWDDFNLDSNILKALKKLQFNDPLPIQRRALKAAIIDQKHVLGAARTGSGKTLAYLIPILNRILSGEGKCRELRHRICKAQKKSQDFELVDGNLVAVEDMIVDNLTNEDEDEELNLDSSSEDEEGLDAAETCLSAIVLVPTRELALQVKDVVDRLNEYTNVNATCIIGGISQDKQVRLLRKLHPQIIIATPGRLYDIIQSDAIEELNHSSIASVGTIVIDEADRMVQKGHFEEMLKIIDILKESKKYRSGLSDYRVYMFSATLTFLHELPDRLKFNPLAAKKESRTSGAKKSKKKNQTKVNEKNHNKKGKIRQMLTLLGIDKAETSVIDINDDQSFGRPSSEQLTEYRINCMHNEKDLFLYYFLIQNPKKRTIIFCNSKDCLRRLSNVLKYLGITTLKLHSEMDQKKRMVSLEKFRVRPDSILIATDIAARGLDVKELDCVVHYQVPRTCESYIHRTGRTARLDRDGTSLTLCEPKEAPAYRRLCNNINNGQDLVDYNIDIHLKTLLKQRVSLAQQCDMIDHRLRETKSNRNWFVKAANECDIELDEEDMRQFSSKGKTQQQNIESEAKERRHLSELTKRLNTLLKKPLVTKAAAIKQATSKFMNHVSEQLEK